MILRKFKVSELLPSDYNPRTISDTEIEKLKKSIQDFGYVEPVVWNEKTKRIVGGHQRVKAMLALGMGDKEIDVVVVSFDLKKEKALNLALNRISGEWEHEALVQLLREMEPVEREQSGFDEEEIVRLLSKKEPEAIEEDEIMPAEKKSEVVEILNLCMKSWNPDDFSELHDLLQKYYPKEVAKWQAKNESDL